MYLLANVTEYRFKEEYVTNLSSEDIGNTILVLIQMSMERWQDHCVYQSMVQGKLLCY